MSDMEMFQQFSIMNGNDLGVTRRDESDGAAERAVPAPPRACIYSNLVPLLTLRSIEALYLAGKGNSRIDVNVM